MKPVFAILTTLGLLVVCIGITSITQFDPTWIMVLATSLWAAVDSLRLRLKLYKLGISYSPVVLFIACALIWIVGFPWYLAVRHKIITGTAVLKDSSPPAHTAPELRSDSVT